MSPYVHRSRPHSLIVLACFAVALFCLAYPIYVIRPFRAQGVRELAAALLILRYRPIVTGACTLLAIVVAVRYWQLQSSRWRRLGVIAGAAGVCIFTGLARVNIYELMFHPMGSPAFASSADVKLDKDEKVLAIVVNGTARAYPIRSISYHHIVNDVVGGVPIAATY
jgi:hypothetical protein